MFSVAVRQLRNRARRIQDEGTQILSTKDRRFYRFIKPLLDPSVSLRTRVAMTVLQLFFSLIVCVMTTVTIILQRTFVPWQILSVILVIFFIINFFFKARIDDSSFLGYLLQLQSIIDLQSSFSLLTSVNSWMSLGFLRMVQCITSLHDLLDIATHFIDIPSLNVQLTKLLFEILSLIYMFAMIFFIFEARVGGDQPLNFFDSVYFTFVTLSTVSRVVLEYL